MVTEGMADMKIEIVSLRNEIVKLGRVVMPLTAITDLSLTQRRALEGESMPDQTVNIAQMTQYERDRQLENLNPQQVLNNLAEYCNTQELPNKRVQQIDARFTSLDKFKQFKDEVAADEERNLA